MAVKPKPDGYHTITPYLMVDDGQKFIDFAKNAFNAVEMNSNLNDEGKIMHAEIKIGDSVIMLSEASSKYPASSAFFYLYVNDCDSSYKQALEAGASSVMQPADQFYGDRNAGVRDSFGNTWWISTHVEDVSPEEMQRRHEEYMQKSKV